MRINPGMKPNDPTYQVALDALSLTTCYLAFLITAEVSVILFKDIINICLKIQGQEFDAPPTEEEALSFICELGAEPPNSRKSQKKLDSAISSEESPSKKKSTKAKKVTATKPKLTKKKADRGKNEGTSTIPGVLDVPKYDSKSEKEYWGGSEEQDDDENDYKNESNNGDNDEDGDDDANDDDNQEVDDTNDNDEETDKKEDQFDDDEEKMDEEEDDEITKELHKDVNVNLRNEDANITDADQENPSPADNEIASLIDTTARHATKVSEITSVFTTTIPLPPPFFNPLPQQATPTPTPTTSIATTSFPSLPDFSSVFKFNDRVTNLEKDLLEIKQVDQYAQALSSIHAIVDYYIDNKLGEAIQKAIVAHNLDFSDFATPVIEKNVTESLEAAVLARSSSQPKSTYKVAATLSKFELIKILMDKMEKNKSYDKADYKRELYDAIVKSYQTDKDLFNTYGEVFTLKKSRDNRDKDQDPFAGSDGETKRRKSSKEAVSSIDSRPKKKKSLSTSKDASHYKHKPSRKSVHAKELSHTVNDSGVQHDQEFYTGNNDKQPADKEVSKADWFEKPERPPTLDFDWNKRKHVDS
uniref:Uncharacterized protein n=1 Tax=Tanacetum cinerariifolium TaxID=118510 RepID=A0A6L2L6S9_TANCI|nr:hypothetical protein [Tanacetum cinerariifolium]